ncbi:hypothetical protein BDN70DRAFT_683039 [Pholiota conissans]|uniref:Uncharacterized protein n=1 Tax=Pholiota conissans TaxID=109636 RepID=A0A9P5Z2N8_9AGAR|nr:hypothetical protein BDN70DRAFT_683039 [Pholiota conissans]
MPCGCSAVMRWQIDTITEKKNIMIRTGMETHAGFVQGYNGHGYGLSISDPHRTRTRTR